MKRRLARFDERDENPSTSEFTNKRKNEHTETEDVGKYQRFTYQAGQQIIKKKKAFKFGL